MSLLKLSALLSQAADLVSKAARLKRSGNVSTAMLAPILSRISEAMDSIEAKDEQPAEDSLQAARSLLVALRARLQPRKLASKTLN